MRENPFDDRPTRLRAKAGFTFALLIAANLAAWSWAWSLFSESPALLGTAFLAYILGLRHAFDIDHIAAIDNVVRKLMQQGLAPYSAGLFFALGHSTIVVLAVLAIGLTANAMQGRFEFWQEAGGLVGGVVSSAFLLAIGLANLVVLSRVWGAFRRARRGEVIGEAELDGMLSGRGFLARLLRPLFAMVNRSWHLYPIGFLFGLGFDTATEIGLLAIAATQASQGMSLGAVLVFPALFTAGMTLMDTADSALMTRAYAWAFTEPLRKLWYNLTITAASVVLALFIGGIGALEMIAEGFGLQGGFWAGLERLNGSLADFGLVVVGIFVASWMLSLLAFRLGAVRLTRG